MQEQHQHIGFRANAQFADKIAELGSAIKNLPEWRLIKSTSNPKKSEIIRFAVERLHQDLCTKPSEAS